MTKERVAIIFFFRFPSLEASYGRPGCGCTVHGVFSQVSWTHGLHFSYYLHCFFVCWRGYTAQQGISVSMEK